MGELIDSVSFQLLANEVGSFVMLRSTSACEHAQGRFNSFISLENHNIFLTHSR
jgi:hypothetical protein